MIGAGLYRLIAEIIQMIGAIVVGAARLLPPPIPHSIEAQDYIAQLRAPVRRRHRTQQGWFALPFDRIDGAAFARKLSSYPWTRTPRYHRHHAALFFPDIRFSRSFARANVMVHEEGNYHQRVGQRAARCHYRGWPPS